VRIYFKGDIARPRDLLVFDADTGVRLPDVLSAQVTLDPRRGAYADLIRGPTWDRKTTCRADVVSAPMENECGACWMFRNQGMGRECGKCE